MKSFVLALLSAVALGYTSQKSSYSSYKAPVSSSRSSYKAPVSSSRSSYKAPSTSYTTKKVYTAPKTSYSTVKKAAYTAPK